MTWTLKKHVTSRNCFRFPIGFPLSADMWSKVIIEISVWGRISTQWILAPFVDILRELDLLESLISDILLNAAVA